MNNMFEEQEIRKKLLIETKDEILKIEEDCKNLKLSIDKKEIELENLKNSLFEDLEKLEELNNKKSILENKAISIQKNVFFEKINPNNIKKNIIDSGIFKTIVQKGKDIKTIIDGSILDESWLDEKYEDYKNLCIKNETEIKSKEDFKKIILQVKKDEDSEVFQINNLFSMAKTNLTKAKSLVKDIINSNSTLLKIEPEIDKSKKIDIEEDLSKKENIDQNELTKNELDKKSLYLQDIEENETLHLDKNLINSEVNDIENTVLKKQEIESLSESIEEKPKNVETPILNLNVYNKEFLLNEWIKEKNIKKKHILNTEPKKLYQEYINFLETKLKVDINDHNLVYSYLSGAFKKILNKTIK